jgi:molybdate transport system ATP-binding protein
MSLQVTLRHRFGAFALDVDFAASDARVTALFGPSGAGKSSIVNAVAGLLRPEEGRIVVGGRVLLDTAAGVFVPPRTRRIGYVFQDARLFPHLSVQRNLLYGWQRNGRRASAGEIAHVIDLLGLEPLRARLPLTLSGGEKSRVALGRALLASPELLLLDEPLAALDTARRGEILPYLERLHDETRVPMIYVSHALDEVTRVADDIVVLKEGRVAAHGSVFDLATALDARVSLGAPPLGAVLSVKLVAHREADGLSVLAFDGGMLTVSRIDREVGAALRARVRAEDIMLALEEPRSVSANNVLAAKILGIADGEGPGADVQLACGNVKLVARITRASARRLKLEPGQSAFAVLKSVTVDV